MNREAILERTAQVSSIVLLQPTEAEGLFEAVSQCPASGLVVEIGCQLGRSSSLILQLAQQIGFHSIHIDPYTAQPDYLRGWIEMAHSLQQPFSLLCMRTEQAKWHLERLLGDGVDVAYIDGDHEAPGVKIDLELVADKVKVGGYLCCHDYGPEFLEEGSITPSYRFPGVAATVDAYTETGWEKIGVYHTLGVWRRTA